MVMIFVIIAKMVMESYEVGFYTLIEVESIPLMKGYSKETWEKQSMNTTPKLFQNLLIGSGTHIFRLGN